MILRRTSSFSLLPFLLAVALLATQPAQAQSGIELENVEAPFRFGEQITFMATVRSSVPVQSAAIVIVDEARGITHTEPLTVPADGRTEFRLDAKQNVLRPFSNIKWSYQFTLSDGSTAQSESFSVRYVDDRFPWQRLVSDTLNVNWHHGDANFGQAALDAARAGLESISRLMPLDLVQPVEIFIYANADDLRATLVPDREVWIAGHADPALGVTMIVIAPGVGQSINMEQSIPHELMHVMLYRHVGAGYQNIPAWLREGMATLVEIYPNADYERALADAADSNALIPVKDLCTSFPADAGQAFLAYAESESFTNYLHETYGSTGLLNLAAAYADGVECERGTERTFGVSLSRLDAQWRSAVLGQNAVLSTMHNILPYMVLLCLVLSIPLIGIVMTLRKRKSQ